jgi:hypothetical protein
MAIAWAKMEKIKADGLARSIYRLAIKEYIYD